MKKSKIVLALLLVVSVLITGCLGGGESKSEEEAPEYSSATGQTGATGETTAEISGNPETLSETVDIPIPFDNVTKASFTIRVEDAAGGFTDAETAPDEVSGALEGSGEGGYTEELQPGATPYSVTINMNAVEGQNLPSSWTLSLTVVCNPGSDRWPGPLMWYGTVDHGFSYDVNVTYTYTTLV